MGNNDDENQTYGCFGISGNLIDMNILSKSRIWLYNKLVAFYPWVYRNLYGMSIGKGTLISRKAIIDRGVNPRGVHIADYVRVTGGGNNPCP